MAKARILIVDDHPLIREGLAGRIALQPDLEVCGEADSVSGALKQLESTSPHVILVDIQLANSHGIDLVKEVNAKYPNIKTLVVSAFEESLYGERALRAGAAGYINKQELENDIVDAVRTVLKGETYCSSRLAQQLIGRAVGKKGASTTGDPVQRLSDRELEVFELIGKGKTTGAIARQLQLSVHTIDTHREKIRHKLGVRNSTELMQRAVQWMLENG